MQLFQRATKITTLLQERQEEQIVELEEYEIVAKSVKEAIPGASLVEDKQYIGNSRDELNRDTRIAWISDVTIQLLTAVVFLFCYYS